MPPGGVKLHRCTFKHNDLTGKFIGAVIEVHKALGLGLLESTYGNTPPQADQFFYPIAGSRLDKKERKNSVLSVSLW